MRSQLALLLLIASTPLAAQQQPLSFLRKSGAAEQDAALTIYKEQPYQPVRPGEVRQSAFLTEGQALPFGKVLGPVSPTQVRSSSTASLALTATLIWIRPPAGAPPARTFPASTYASKHAQIRSKGVAVSSRCA